VRFWITVNEPTVYAKHAYVLGHFPPCRRNGWLAARRVIANMCRAHRLAYRILHDARADAMVSFAHSGPWIVPCAPDRILDRAAAYARDLFVNRLCFWLVSEGGRPLLDYVALNYYTRMVVRWAPRGKAILFGEDCRLDHHGAARRYTAGGAEIHPEGLRRMIASCAAYGLPIIVTENGVDTGDDEVRSAFLVDHLRELGMAVRDGHDVRGYLHWSLMDNYEWAQGTTARFGLAATDFATQARTPRPAARIFAEVCRANRLSLGARKEAELA
jgi:beta-glucosidase